MEKTVLVFIGSSSESKEVMGAIQSNLQNRGHHNHINIEGLAWDKGVFNLGENTLDELIKAAGKCDFAVLVFGRDSIVKERGGTHFTARDNVVFELGLFMGILGKNRAYIVAHDDVKLPSDMDGITIARYKTPEKTNLINQLRGQCEEIYHRIEELCLNPSKYDSSSVEDSYVKWWEEKNSNRQDRIVIKSIDGTEIFVSPRTFSPDVKLTYSTLAISDVLPSDLTGKRVLDLGCGCGILSILSAKRGAKSVTAVDISKSAIEDTQNNISRLVKEGRLTQGIIEIVESDLFENVRGEYDYIIANLPISSKAKYWQGIGRSIEDVVSNCIRGVTNHLEAKAGILIFVWASFGSDEIASRFLDDDRFKVNSHMVETFGVKWFVYEARIKTNT
ncbi:TIR domain-containing protein [Sessilibacter corallicola]|uniref:TIR domain-containing protein n=1 Tax=Sessilibacter corallicola TaxID=2904075 RepID=UPI001E3D35C0|nr:TIR domain-containing protein [Sessilibacter corallicola]MCE2029911.1 nucleotide-binding protein [Sessilibacter corallicola]